MDLPPGKKLLNTRGGKESIYELIQLIRDEHSNGYFKLYFEEEENIAEGRMIFKDSNIVAGSIKKLDGKRKGKKSIQSMKNALCDVSTHIELFTYSHSTSSISIDQVLSKVSNEEKIDPICIDKLLEQKEKEVESETRGDLLEKYTEDDMIKNGDIIRKENTNDDIDLIDRLLQEKDKVMEKKLELEEYEEELKERERNLIEREKELEEMEERKIRSDKILESVQRKEKRLESEFHNIKNKKEKIENEIEDIQKEKEKLNKRKQKIDEKERDFEELEKEISEKKREIDSKEDKISSRLEELEKEGIRLTKIKEELKERQAVLDKREKELDQLKRRLDGRKGALIRKEKRLEEMKKEMENKVKNED